MIELENIEAHLMGQFPLNTRVYVTDKVTDKAYNNALDLNDANNAYKFMDELSKNEFLNGIIDNLYQVHIRSIYL